jgi:hypothetical protein
MQHAMAQKAADVSETAAEYKRLGSSKGGLQTALNNDEARLSAMGEKTDANAAEYD